MANLTADREDYRKVGDLRYYPVAATTKLFKGSLVAVDTGGHAVKAAATANFVTAGVAFEQVDNTGAAGDKDVRVWATGSFVFNFSGTATQADVGKQVYAVDDNTVKLFDGGAGAVNVLVGRIVEFISASSVRVAITTDVAS